MSRKCPYCNEREIETVATVPFVRGKLVSYTLGVHKLIGCKPCVRRAIYREVGVSSVAGWFSPMAAVINPMMITYNMFRGITLRPDQGAVSRVLEQAGIPEEGLEADPLRVAYGLAAAMIAADGKLEDEEVAVALEVGRLIFADFDDAEFYKVLGNHKHLPKVADLAKMLADILEDKEKSLVFGYLAEIAASDGEVAKSEETMLARVRQNLDLPATATMSFARGQLPAE